MGSIRLGKEIEIHRNRDGVPSIVAPNRLELLRGLGYMHVRDRGMQMEINRLMAHGSASEYLASTPFLIRADTTVRRLGLHREPQRDLELIDSHYRALLDAYVDGVNLGWKQQRPPLFRLLRYRPKPWRAEDLVVILRTVVFFGLTTMQIRLEKSLFDLIRRGVPVELLQELFGSDLEGVDAELLRSVKLLRDEPTWGEFRLSYAAGLVSGNAWVVSGSRTASKSPIIANDPHMDVGHLPAMWYEAELHAPDTSLAGATAPGLPAVIFGRNRYLGWGIAHAPGDIVDFYVEECRNGKRRVGQGWEPFKERVEEMKIRSGEVRRFSVYTSEHGVLEGNPYSPGKYLSMRWVGQPGLFGPTLEAWMKLQDTRTVSEAMEAVKAIQLPTLSWLFADSFGDIGYQVTGAFPRRRPGWSGLYPAPGWDERYDWEGLVDVDDLPWALNPPEGFLVTANQAQNPPDGPVIMNAALPRWRYQRICNLLGSQSDWNIDKVQQIQYDVVSPLAKRLLPLFLKYLDPQEEEVKAEFGRWQYTYTAEARQPAMLENICRAALLVVFGDGGIGRNVLTHLIDETTFSLSTSHLFFRVLTDPGSAWFAGRDYDECMRAAVREGLAQPSLTWAEYYPLIHKNLLLGRRLPFFFRVNRGPFGVWGHHSTILQFTEYREGGIRLSIAPSYRFVSDMGSHEIWTNLPGGASEKPYSRYYANDLPHWRYGEYKRLRLRSRN
ncbi:MAG: penicillin acylase family protein [Bradymonadales bacterium]|nr:penicillin acylase family protein [Bradymonadales bacterium]